MRSRQRRGAGVRSEGPLFTAWMERSRADLALLTSDLPTGPYPYAGIPWFSTPFGRDAVITSLQTLWLNPRLARGVLAFLAAHQAHDKSAFLDSAPGKIMHETRKGEMADAARIAVRPVLRRRRHHAAVRDAGRRLRAIAPATWRSSTTLWPALLARHRMDRTRLRCQPERLPRLRARRDQRPGQPGLEGQRGFGVPRRRTHSRTARSRWSRCRGMRSPPCARWRSSRAIAASTRPRTPGGRARERLRGGGRAAFLDAGARLLRHRDRRRRRSCAACAPAIPATCCMSACPRPNARRSTAAQLLIAGIRHRLGRAHAGRGRAALQPDVLPQRIGVAARHRAVRGGHRAATAIAAARCACCARPSRRPRISTCACRNCSADSPARMARRRCPIRLPACRRRGRPGSVFMMLQACLGIRVDGWHNEIHVVRPQLPPGIEQVALRGHRRRALVRGPGVPAFRQPRRRVLRRRRRRRGAAANTRHLSFRDGSRC